MRYHVKWITTFSRINDVNKSIVEADQLPELVDRIVLENSIIIQVEPIA